MSNVIKYILRIMFSELPLEIIYIIFNYCDDLDKVRLLYSLNKDIYNSIINNNLIKMHSHHNIQNFINSKFFIVNKIKIDCRKELWEYNLKINKNKSFFEKITHVKYSNKYKDNVYPLPNNVEYIELPDHFNFEIKYFPSKLKYLKLGNQFNQKISGVKKLKIDYLKLGNTFDKTIMELPDSLLVLEFGNDFDQDILFLPKNLIRLTLGKKFSKNILSIPKNLKIIKIHKTSEYDYSKNKEITPDLNRVKIEYYE